MDFMEITETARMSCEEVAARLHALADALARHNDVPDEVDLKLEIEIGTP